MAELKRKMDLMSSARNNNSTACSNVKCKHPRLLMGGLAKEPSIGNGSGSSTSKRLVIEFAMSNQSGRISNTNMAERMEVHSSTGGEFLYTILLATDL